MMIAVLAVAAAGLSGGQELYKQNHWAEARQHLQAAWPSLSESEKVAAAFLIGRAFGREAELYQAVHRFTVTAGREYLSELAAMPGNRTSRWIPLFAAFYDLEAGRWAEAERALMAAQRSPALAPEWKVSARLRRGAALLRLGRGAEAKALLRAAAGGSPDAAAELQYWSVWADPSKTAGAAAALATPPASRRGRLAAAAVLYRAGLGAAADAKLKDLDLDLPDVEDAPDKSKTLRFFDPLASRAWERVLWERAALELKPLAERSGGPEVTLSAFYRAMSLWSVGAHAEAASQIKAATDAAVLGDLASVQKLVTAASGWAGRPPAPAVIAPLWHATLRQPDAVLFWADLVREGPAKSLEGGVVAALRDPPSADKSQGAAFARWGLARLALGAEPRDVLDVLESVRDKSNKNKLESNDPLLLLAICAARTKTNDYAQALETLFEMGKTLPGLRPLQWNLQGLYAARQKAGGEARISQ